MARRYSAISGQTAVDDGSWCEDAGRLTPSFAAVLLSRTGSGAECRRMPQRRAGAPSRPVSPPQFSYDRESFMILIAVASSHTALAGPKRSSCAQPAAASGPSAAGPWRGPAVSATASASCSRRADVPARLVARVRLLSGGGKWRLRSEPAVDDGSWCRRRADAAAPGSRERDLGAGADRSEECCDKQTEVEHR